MAEVAHIFISGIIGDSLLFDGDDMGTTLADVRRQFDSFDDPESVTVHINSRGGDVWEGFAIHDYLINLGMPVRTIGEGKIFSIATVILLAGDKGSREMTPNATFMIHNPLSGEYGNADDLEKLAEELRSLESRLSNFYAQKTGQEADLLRDMMDAETFLTAQDAQRLGFIDVIHEPARAIAYFGPKKKIDSQNNVVMENQDVKEVRSLLQEIKAFFAPKNEQAAAEEAPAPETAQPETGEQATDEELDTLRQENEQLKAQLAALQAQAETDKANAEQQIEQQAAVIAQIQQKVEALERMPIIAGGADQTKSVTPPAGEKPEPHPFDGAAAYFRNKFGDKF